MALMYSIRRSKRRRNRLAFPSLVAAGGGALLLLPAFAIAACGLEGCPAEIPETGDRRIHVEHEVREFSYSVLDTDGNYTRYQTRFEFIMSGGACGVSVPLVHLRDRDENATGLSGVVLFGERTLASSPADVFGYGFQLELPGSGSARIKSDHAELLPYISMRSKKAGATMFAMTGVRVALQEADPILQPEAGDTITLTMSADKIAHGGGEEILVVNPHERWEMTARIGVNFGDLHGTRPSFYLHGDRVLQGDREGDTFGHAGVMLRIPVGTRWSIRPVAEVPFGGLRRFDWNAGVGVRFSH